jgi:uncharacterized protein YbaP (TraB family)
MKTITTLADRATMPMLGLIALAHVLFLTGFLIMLTLATGKAHAEAPQCSGHDMLAELDKSDPALAASIRTEAAETPNGKGLLWKIEKPGRETSYLFGTMHMTDPRVISLTAPAQKAFEASSTVVIETTDVLDQAAMMTSIMSKPELMMFTDSTTLDSLMSPEDKAVVSAALDKRGIPAGSVTKMKPWILSAMLALPACELARKAEGAPVLDVKLAEDAKAQGKKLEGLETALSQLEAMASLPIAMHVKGLIDTLKLGDRMDDVMETMIVLYTQGDTGTVWPLFRAILPAGKNDAADYAAFEQTMITTRNHGMVKNAEPILAAGSTFIAVGALHLPGKEGLVELFRQAGYTVSPAG